MFNNVMVIDDSQVDLYVSKRMMTKVNFAQDIITMDSAREALGILETDEHTDREPPNLILLDINMPGMNGFEFLQEFKNLAEKVKNRWAIVMLSSSSNTKDREAAAENPFVKRYLSKPLSKELLEHLNLISSELISA